MAGSFTEVDLSKLPAPQVIEEVDYAVILQEMIDDLIARDPTFTAMVESDPAYKILEVCAYREFILRTQFNDRAKGVLLAFATDGDLDHLASFFGVQRKILVAGDPLAVPPIEEVLESDDDLRLRTQLALESFTTAGSEGAYLFHTLSVVGVKDASIYSPLPGDVEVSLLSTTGNGIADAGLIASVNAALNAEFVRPLTDNVTVQSATVNTFTIDADIYIFPTAAIEVVEAAALAAAQAYVDDAHKVGREIYVSAVIAALHVEGVENVVITNPSADIINDYFEASYCTAINLTVQEAV